MTDSPLALMVPTCAISVLPLVGLACILEVLDDLGDRRVDAALDVHRVVPGGDQLGPLGVDGLREHGRGGGAVTGDVGGLGGDLLHHLRAHVGELVLELDLLGDGDAVLGHRRRPPGLLDDDVAAARPQRHLDRVGQDVEPARDAVAGVLEKTISLAAMTSVSVSVEFVLRYSMHREDVVLAQDQVLGAVDLDLVARVLREQDLVARLDLQLAERSVLLRSCRCRRRRRSASIGFSLAVSGMKSPPVVFCCSSVRVTRSRS